MANMLKREWLQAHLLTLLDTAESARISFRASGYLQARIFHNYRFMDGLKELNPHELISADVSDTFCNIRSFFTRALEARLQKEKGWRLTELRGSILAKVTGVLCITENASSNGLTVALEIDSFVPLGDAGGAVYGEPVWFDSLPEVRVILNKHHVLKLVGPSTADFRDIRSQASEQSSDEESQKHSSQLLTQSASARAKTGKIKGSHIDMVQAKHNDYLVNDFDSLLPRSTKRRRLHTGWADFRDLTYYDCQIPAAQQKILDDEDCWLPRGDYAIEPIKQKSRKSQATKSDAGPKQTKLSLQQFQQNSPEMKSLDHGETKSDAVSDDDVDDHISWAESPEPEPKNERIFVFNAEQLERIRRQQVDHSPPPDSSPSSIRDAWTLSPVMADQESEVQAAATIMSYADDSYPSSALPITAHPVNEAHHESSANSHNPDEHSAVGTPIEPFHNETNKGRGYPIAAVPMSDRPISDAVDEVANDSQPLTNSTSNVDQVALDRRIRLTLQNNATKPDSPVNNMAKLVCNDVDTVLQHDSDALEAETTAAQPSSPQFISVTNESSPRSTQELPASSSLMPSPRQVQKPRTIPWASASPVVAPATSPSVESASDRKTVSSTAFVSPYDIAARRSSQSPKTTWRSSRPWQQTSSYRLAYASPRSTNGNSNDLLDTQIHRRPTKVELQRLVFAARAPSQERSSPLRSKEYQPATPTGVLSVIDDTPQMQGLDSRGKSFMSSGPTKTPLIISQKQARTDTQGHERRSSRVRKFDLSKLQQQNVGGKDVQDLLDRHRATYLRYRQPPPSSDDAQFTLALPADTPMPSPTRKRKVDEVEETQGIEPVHDPTNSDDEIFDTWKQSIGPWYDDPDTPLRKILNTTLKARGQEPGWHVTSWGDTLDALDKRNRERGA
ncbi:protein of unknown function [Taphrina deformans PYCC 5710]|uniref:Telomere replication protein EST3 n=1 Tax=Taphrina deformans (strain PYCC 5710 / ATCC 11124 / CBS 356.35 / IMI 108563 / JCM 9778 / NBRC 8474) TaxID=1097556 RepID=R4XNG3_TAPDE|nr:protein of unknown function [Taphrina deformans PYCC 5710]|eukprot:CCG84784.1 protein of unknown function [Taphrina deformans PYCC 5710]